MKDTGMQTIRELSPRRRKNIQKKSGGERVVYTLAFIILSLYAVSLILPFVWLILASLKDSTEYSIDIIQKKAFALPDKMLFVNYLTAFKQMDYNGTNFLGMIFNSIWYTAITAFAGVMTSAVTGYCIAKFRFKGRAIIYGIAIFSMTIPIIGNMAASFKLVSALKLYDSPLHTLFTSLSGFGFNFLIMYGFFSNISWSYAEAVLIDGGGHFTVFFKVMLPQAFAPMLTLIIMASINAWNDYLTPILYLPSYPNVASGLHFIERDMTRRSMPVFFSAMVISLIPVLVLFVTFANKIMTNVSVGGLKG